ncbi:hypothetical protein L6452_07154 [Arctium lappa]|uniref:Uncharacterized protein n=1 Tax=Arctium lappa TaxID=4217 RepID=A0ACB9EKL4_ARCLA|nr:hypothetical protein L6452_07154 [Arctium lappa]
MKNLRLLRIPFSVSKKECPPPPSACTVPKSSYKSTVTLCLILFLTFYPTKNQHKPTTSKGISVISHIAQIPLYLASANKQTNIHKNKSAVARSQALLGFKKNLKKSSVFCSHLPCRKRKKKSTFSLFCLQALLHKSQSYFCPLLSLVSSTQLGKRYNTSLSTKPDSFIFFCVISRKSLNLHKVSSWVLTKNLFRISIDFSEKCLG